MISKHSIQRVLFFACLPAGLISCSQERSIEITDVPRAVLVAAETAVAGLQVSSAEVEVERGLTVYELDGLANGLDYEVEVTAEGQVLEVDADD